MPKINQQGVIHLFVPIILLIGLVAGIYLITSGNPLKLFSKASSNPIIFVLPDGTKCNPVTITCRIATSSATIKVELTSTLGSPVGTPATTARINILGTSEQVSLDGFNKTFGSKKGDARYNPLYDANRDGRISTYDFSVLKALFNKQNKKPSVSSQANAASLNQTINLSAGWDSIGLTVSKANYKAEDLLVEFNTQLSSSGSRATQIVRWNGGRQEFHTLGQQANNFNIIPGEGYQIRTTRGGRVIISGDQAAVSSININQGYASFSLPTIPSNINTAESLLQEMKKQGIDVSSISRWKDGRWDSHIINFPANNYSLEAGKGYQVRNTGSAKIFTIAFPTSTPSPIPSSTPTSTSIPSATPAAGTRYYKIAENLTDLDSATWQIYDQEPKVVDYTFRDTNPGQKFIWVDFQSSDNRTDRRSAQVELLVPTSSPSPTALGQTQSSPSLFSKAIKVEGNQGVIVDGSKLSNNPEFTIEGWVKWNDDTKEGYQAILSKAESKTNREYVNSSFDLTISNTIWGKDLLGRALGANVKVLRAGNVLGDKSWHHIALINISKGMGSYGSTLYSTQLYVDGRLQDSDDHYGPISFGSGDLQIGWKPLNRINATVQQNQSFYGEIDEVRLSKVARYTTDFVLPYSPFITDSNTIGLWHFDNNLQDSSGGGNNGQGTNIQFIDSTVRTNYNYQPPIFPMPGFGNAIQFNREGSVMANQTHTIGRFTNLTMEAWIKLARTGESNPIVSKNLSGNYAYSLEITPQNKLKFTYSVLYQNRWAPTEIESTSTINTENWNHVAVVYNSVPLSADQGKLSLYINGLRVAQADQTGEIGGGSETNYGANILIGTDPGGANSFSGAIDEVRISNGVKYLGSGRAGATPGVFSPALDTLLLCHFDENSGNPSCTNGSGSAISTISGDIIYLRRI